MRKSIMPCCSHGGQAPCYSVQCTAMHSYWALASSKTLLYLALAPYAIVFLQDTPDMNQAESAY